MGVQSKATPKRLNLEMSERLRSVLENLREQTDAESLADVVRKALAVYDFLWQEKASGGRLVIKGKDGERELVLL
jgi:hypothetical protein